MKLSTAKPAVFLLDIIALSMIAPLIHSLLLGDGNMARAFAIPALACLIPAVPFHILTWKQNAGLRPSSVYPLVFVSWILCVFFGALPWLLSGAGFNAAAALFESSCGFATTGASTFAYPESIPRPLLLWRSITHWEGGMGIVLLTVALLPLFGTGGFLMAKAETPGPDREKITPRMTATAKYLWLIYCGLTLILILLYRAGGMDWFDAVCHALPVMASGGVSTKNSGFAYYRSAYIDIVTVVFMLLAGINFSLYYRIFRGKIKDVLRNTELRAYLLLFLAASLALCGALVPFYGSFARALHFATAQCASVLSTTGAVFADYETWPPVAQAVIFFLFFAGGCSGSTAGGVKVIRHVVLWKQAGTEIRRLIYPRAVFSMTLDQGVARRGMVYSVAGFVCAWGLTVVIATLATSAAGYGPMSSLATALAVTGNIGIGFGASGPARYYGGFPDWLKCFYSAVMIAGRLELWAVLVFITPSRWKR